MNDQELKGLLRQAIDEAWEKDIDDIPYTEVVAEDGRVWKIPDIGGVGHRQVRKDAQAQATP